MPCNVMPEAGITAAFPMIGFEQRGEEQKWPELERIAERLLGQSELSALGPVAECRVLAGKGPKPKVGIQEVKEVRFVAATGRIAEIAWVSSKS